MATWLIPMFLVSHSLFGTVPVDTSYPEIIVHSDPFTLTPQATLLPWLGGLQYTLVQSESEEGGGE